MIIVITGSRSISDASPIERAIADAVTGPIGGYGALDEVRELWHGGAKGVDTVAAGIATSRGWTLRAFEVTGAEWEADRRLAGKRRNWRMLNEAKKAGGAVVVAVWDGVSGGTAHAIGWAAAMGLPVHVHVERGGR